MAPQTGRRRSLDKAQRTLQKGSWGCDTNWLFSLHTTVLCLRCSIGALPHLLAPASYSKLPHTFGRDLWLVFSSPSKLLGDSNSLRIASSGPRVSVAAAVLTNRVIKTGKCLSLPTQPTGPSREGCNLGGVQLLWEVGTAASPLLLAVMGVTTVG